MAKPVKQSVNNEMEHNGITQGGIRQQLTLFFLPILVGSFLQQLYNTADAVVVGGLWERRPSRRWAGPPT